MATDKGPYLVPSRLPRSLPAQGSRQSFREAFLKFGCVPQYLNISAHVANLRGGPVQILFR
jgi:hypothetical protein